MNKIIKAFDYSDINNFLPDLHGNADFWNKKIFGLPDGYPELLEAMSRLEHSDETIVSIGHKIQQESLDFRLKMELEFKDRETNTHINIINDDENNNIVVIHNDQ
jgi:hypothetical protein